MSALKPYILLTGATSAIGQSIAEALRNDYPLLLHGRDTSKLETLKKHLNSPNSVEIWTADLSVINSLKSSLKELMASKNITVEGFVHCAGTLKLMPFKTFREDFISDIFNVNVFSAVAIIQTLLAKTNLPDFRRIIFISSLSSIRGDKGNTMYAASKGALNSLVRSLALELAPSITVNSILPGTIETSMTKQLFDDPQERAALETKYPLGTGAPEDVAAMVKFLLSNDAKWITAQNYNVDGGGSAI